MKPMMMPAFAPSEKLHQPRISTEHRAVELLAPRNDGVAFWEEIKAIVLFIAGRLLKEPPRNINFKKRTLPLKTLPVHVRLPARSCRSQLAPLVTMVAALGTELYRPTAFIAVVAVVALVRVVFAVVTADGPP